MISIIPEYQETNGELLSIETYYFDTLDLNMVQADWGVLSSGSPSLARESHGVNDILEMNKVHIAKQIF